VTDGVQAFETELRGYRREQVDAAIVALNNELGEARRKMASMQMASLQEAPKAPDAVTQLGESVMSIVRAAEEAAAKRAQEAEDNARGIRDLADRRLREAEETAQGIRAAAERALGEAQAAAQQVKADAEASAEAGRAALEEERRRREEEAAAERARLAEEGATTRREAEEQASAVIAQAREEAATIEAEARARHQELRGVEAELRLRVGDLSRMLDTLRAGLEVDPVAPVAADNGSSAPDNGASSTVIDLSEGATSDSETSEPVTEVHTSAE
jgi:colicin import membrane protein